MARQKTVNDKIIKILKDYPEQRFTAREIAIRLIEIYPEAMRQKRDASTQDFSDDNKFVNQLVAEIGSKRPELEKRHPIQFKYTSDRPRKFYWVSNKSRNESGSTDAEAISTQANQAELRGHDLYPILSSYLEQDLAIYAKRIDEKKSRNNRGLGGNRWLYPDIVGIENIAEAWDSEIVKAAEIFGAPRANIYSFEVKLQLTQSNVREAYFQAVSNSSWANFGYLVAAEVQGDDTATELRMLFGLHGIGVIQLNADEPNESQIIIPARQRSSVDWATCDRLFSENKDFNDFIIRARGYYQTSRFEPFKS